MSITQRYWLTFAPALILMGFFFGVGGFLFVFLPTYVIYQGHRRDWSIWRMTWVSASLLFFGTWLVAVT